MLKQEKGITLVALVITIIVMLILVAVVVTISLDDNGLLSKTRDAANQTNVAAGTEANYINAIEGLINNAVVQ